MSSKEELLHDISMVVLMSSKQDMSIASNAERYLKYFEQKKTLNSPVGVQYLQRLKQISGGTNPKSCFVCKKNDAYDGVLCEACMSKFSRGTKDFCKKKDDDFETLNELFENPEPKSESVKRENVSHSAKSISEPNVRDNNKKNKSQNKYKGRFSELSIIAIILACICNGAGFIGSILGIIDLSHNDGRKKSLSVASVIIGVG